MGRPRKPAKLLEISGAFRKNPQRRKARAAELRLEVGLGEPPQEWLEGAEVNGRHRSLVEIWRRVVAQDLLHVLNASHWLLVRNYCQLQYKVDRAMAGYGKATSGDFSELKKYLSALGQTPIDSPKVAEAVRIPDHDALRKQAAGPWSQLAG